MPYPTKNGKIFIVRTVEDINGAASVEQLVMNTNGPVDDQIGPDQIRSKLFGAPGEDDDDDMEFDELVDEAEPPDLSEMVVDSDGRGTVLTGGTQALLKEHPPGNGVDSTEHASGP